MGFFVIDEPEIEQDRDYPHQEPYGYIHDGI